MLVSQSPGDHAHVMGRRKSFYARETFSERQKVIFAPRIYY